MKFNFFISSFADAFTLLGAHIEPSRLSIILPVGISFYTFQTLSYSIDIYRKRLSPTKDIIAFFSFVSFFPQLVAAPIERATNLLPQFYKKRNFDYNLAVDGMRQILWGLFKKMVIADNCAEVANAVFASSDTASGSTLAIGAVFFSFQIYADFSGYSDIARGSAKCFGFVDEPDLSHAPDDPVSPRFGLRVVAPRIIIAGRFWQSSEEGGFGDAEIT